MNKHPEQFLNEISTTLLEHQEEKTATDYVVEAVIDDISLLDTINKPPRPLLYAALTLTIHNALSEVQTIAYLSKNKDEFYSINMKYIAILSMYQEILQEKMKEFKKNQLKNKVIINKHSQLFVIMLSKLFSLIKRADIYFDDPTHLNQFKHLLPVQMYIDNVVTPEQNKEKTE